MVERPSSLFSVVRVHLSPRHLASYTKFMQVFCRNDDRKAEYEHYSFLLMLIYKNLFQVPTTEISKQLTILAGHLALGLHRARLVNFCLSLWFIVFL